MSGSTAFTRALISYKRREHKVEAAVQLVKEESTAALRFLGHILSRLTQLHNDGAKPTSEPRFYLDWDILHEAIYADRAQSVFGGAIWQTLSTLSAKAPDTRFTIPDGTLREMHDHLQDIVSESSALKRHLDREPPDSNDPPTSIHYWSDAWKDLLPEIRVNLHIKTISRLAQILDTFCQPRREQIPDPSVYVNSYYLPRLQRDRPGQTRNNDADSLNLAVVDLLQRSDENNIHKLVTATGPVLRANSSLTADPTYLYLHAYMRTRFADPRQRQHEIVQCIRDISSFIVNMDHVRDLETQGPENRIDHAKAAAATIKAVDANHRLKDLLDGMSLLSQDIRNRINQVSLDNPPADAETLVPMRYDESISTLRRKIAHLLDQVIGSRRDPEVFGLQLEVAHICHEIRRLTLRQPHRDQVIAIAEFSANGAVATNWPTFESLHVFSRVIALPLQELGHVEVGIACRMPNELGVRAKTVGTENILDAVSELVDDKMPRLVIVSSRGLRFWYHFVGEPRADTKAPQPNRIAVAIASAGDVNVVGQVFDETAAFWISPMQLCETIKTKGERRAK